MIDEISVTHISSAHTRYDIRIFVKMCNSASKFNLNVNYVVADGKGNESINNINIVDVGEKKGGKFSRMTNTVWRVYKKALESDANIYHLHDPELILIGLLLKLKGKKVIFDAHEDLPKQINSKTYLSPIIRYPLSVFFRFFEYLTCRWFDFIITATPSIRDKFKKINKNTLDVNNYPLVNELYTISENKQKDKVIYTGVITEIRCASEMIEAIEFDLSNKIFFAGPIRGVGLEKKIKEHHQIEYLGQLDRVQMANLFSDALVGLVLFKPLPNHLDSQPNKMFEYMSAGIPIVTSDFPLWKEIVEKYDCGFCVNPLNPKEIFEAIQKFKNDFQLAKKMGLNGRKAVLNFFNWDSEEIKLINIYNKIKND